MVNVQPYEIGCEPSPSVPAETLIQDGWNTFLLFCAVSKSPGESGALEDLGVAVLECRNCTSAKFGYPNDEGLPEHPLYHHGLKRHSTNVLEVLESPWLQEVEDQKRASAARIWGPRGLSDSFAKQPQRRHFIIPLKEKTFECIASGMTVKKYYENFDEALAYVRGQMEPQD